MKRCELEPEKICDECGECDRCDLDPEKICDNCCMCLESSDEFNTVKVDRIITDEDEADEYQSYGDDDNHGDHSDDDYSDDEDDDPDDEYSDDEDSDPDDYPN